MVSLLRLCNNVCYLGLQLNILWHYIINKNCIAYNYYVGAKPFRCICLYLCIVQYCKVLRNPSCATSNRIGWVSKYHRSFYLYFTCFLSYIFDSFMPLGMVVKLEIILCFSLMLTVLLCLWVGSVSELLK